MAAAGAPTTFSDPIQPQAGAELSLQLPAVPPAETPPGGDPDGHRWLKYGEKLRGVLGETDTARPVKRACHKGNAASGEGRTRFCCPARKMLDTDAATASPRTAGGGPPGDPSSKLAPVSYHVNEHNRPKAISLGPRASVFAVPPASLTPVTRHRLMDSVCQRSADPQGAGERSAAAALDLNDPPSEQQEDDAHHHDAAQDDAGAAAPDPAAGPLAGVRLGGAAWLICAAALPCPPADAGLSESAPGCPKRGGASGGQQREAAGSSSRHPSDFSAATCGAPVGALRPAAMRCSEGPPSTRSTEAGCSRWWQSSSSDLLPQRQSVAVASREAGCQPAQRSGNLEPRRSAFEEVGPRLAFSCRRTQVESPSAGGMGTAMDVSYEGGPPLQASTPETTEPFNETKPAIAGLPSSTPRSQKKSLPTPQTEIVTSTEVADEAPKAGQASFQPSRGSACAVMEGCEAQAMFSRQLQATEPDLSAINPAAGGVASCPLSISLALLADGGGSLNKRKRAREPGLPATTMPAAATPLLKLPAQPATAASVPQHCTLLGPSSSSAAEALAAFQLMAGGARRSNGSPTAAATPASNASLVSETPTHAPLPPALCASSSTTGSLTLFARESALPFHAGTSSSAGAVLGAAEQRQLGAAGAAWLVLPCIAAPRGAPVSTSASMPPPIRRPQKAVALSAGNSPLHSSAPLAGQVLLPGPRSGALHSAQPPAGTLHPVVPPLRGLLAAATLPGGSSSSAGLLPAALPAVAPHAPPPVLSAAASSPLPLQTEGGPQDAGLTSSSAGLISIMVSNHGPATAATVAGRNGRGLAGRTEQSWGPLGRPQEASEGRGAAYALDRVAEEQLQQLSYSPAGAFPSVPVLSSAAQRMRLLALPPEASSMRSRTACPSVGASPLSGMEPVECQRNAEAQEEEAEEEEQVQQQQQQQQQQPLLPPSPVPLQGQEPVRPFPSCMSQGQWVSHMALSTLPDLRNFTAALARLPAVAAPAGCAVGSLAAVAAIAFERRHPGSSRCELLAAWARQLGTEELAAAAEAAGEELVQAGRAAVAAILRETETSGASREVTFETFPMSQTHSSFKNMN